MVAHTILALGKPRQRDLRFEGSLNYVAKPCLKKKKRGSKLKPIFVVLCRDPLPHF